MLAKTLEVLGLKARAVHQVPESYSSLVYRITLRNGDVIVKVPYSRTKLWREKTILEKLEGLLPVPRVLDFFPGDEETPGALLLSHIPGHPAQPSDYHLSGSFGALLAKLHCVKMDRFELGQDPRNWWEGISQVFEGWKAECEGVLDEGFLEDVTNAWKEHFPCGQEADGPCLVHMDYRPGNILVHNDEVVALIDFESSRGGSADIDFTKMHLYLWDPFPHTRQEFLSGYASIRKPPPVEPVLPFYLMHHAVGGLAWCVRRGLIASDFWEENMALLRYSMQTTRGHKNPS